MTLAPKNSGISSIYALDVTTGTLTEPLIATSTLWMTSKISRKGDRVALWNTTFDPQFATSTASLGSSLSERWQLVVRASDDWQEGTEPLLSSPLLLWPRLVDWSFDDTRLATMVIRGLFENVNDWESLVLSATSGKIVRRDIKGTHPQWSPDGRFLLTVQDKGVYLHDLTAAVATSTLVIEYFGQGTSSAHDKMSVSPTGKYLARTRSDLMTSPVEIFEIEQWSPFKVSPAATPEQPIVGQYFYWPVFSPDERYLVVQRIRRMEDPANTTSDLIVYDLHSGDRKELFSLAAFDPDLSFVTDWR
jgi:hypothetical protein